MDERNELLVKISEFISCSNNALVEEPATPGVKTNQITSLALKVTLIFCDPFLCRSLSGKLHTLLT